MWIARADYQKLIIDLAAETARRQQLEIEVARMTQRDDWLITRVNSLEHERQGLFERFLQVAYPAPEIARANEYTPSPVRGPVGRPVTDYPAEPSTPAPAARPGIRMPVMVQEPARVAHPAAAAATKLSAADDPATALSVLQVSGAAFEDMGDEAAEKLGVAWDGFGNVQHAPGA